MSTDGKKKQGFASFSREQHRIVSMKGGLKRTPKGFAKMDKERRSEVAKKAAQARWEKVRQQREVNDEPDTSGQRSSDLGNV